jgi:hypothetical protein
MLQGFFSSSTSSQNSNMFFQAASARIRALLPSAQNRSAAQRLAVAFSVVLHQALPLVVSVGTTTPPPPHLLSVPLTPVVASLVVRTRPAALVHRPELEVCSEAETLEVDSAPARPMPTPRRALSVLLQVDSAPQTQPTSPTTVPQVSRSRLSLRRMAHPPLRPSSIRPSHSKAPIKTTRWKSCG